MGDLDNSTQIEGATDFTEIGNVGDRLKVDAALTVDQDLLNGRLFAASTNQNMTVGAADNSLLLFRNPAGSGKNYYIVRVASGVAVTNIMAVFKIFGSATVTANGTTLNAYSMKRVASPTAATALVTTLPTVSSNGQQLISMTAGQNNSPTILVDAALISLEPNQNLLITGAPASNNREASLTIIWAEVAQ